MRRFIIVLIILALPVALFAEKSEEEYRAALMAELWEKDGNKKKNIDEAALNRIIENMRIRGYKLSPTIQSRDSGFEEHRNVYTAIENNLTEFLLFLLDCGFDEVMEEGEPAQGVWVVTYVLEELVERNNVEMVRVLLEKGYKAGLNRYPHEFRTLPVLLMAADAGNAEMVKLLIHAGAKVNTRYEVNSDFASNIGWTALIYAAAKGHTDVVRVLLDAGIDIHIKSEHGKVDQVVKDGSWVPVKSQIGWNALQHAANQNHNDIVRLLVEAGAVQAMVNIGGVRVLSKPAEAGGDILSNLDKNDVVSILSRSAKEERIQNMYAPWYKIRTKDGTVGYSYGYFFDVDSEEKKLVPTY